MTVTIEVVGIRAVGRHGVLAEEQHRAQPFEIDLLLDVDGTGHETDDLADTVDYSTIVEAVARVVELESYFLLERLAERIATMCRADHRVTRVAVTVRKLRPPVPVQVASIGVTVVR